MSATTEPADTMISAEVHPAGSYARARVRWGYFLLLNAIAAAIAAGIIAWVFGADQTDIFFDHFVHWFFDHPGVSSAMAFSPLLASLLVGWGYSRRARRRKEAERQREAIAAAAREARPV